MAGHSVHLGARHVDGQVEHRGVHDGDRAVGEVWANCFPVRRVHDERGPRGSDDGQGAQRAVTHRQPGVGHPASHAAAIARQQQHVAPFGQRGHGEGLRHDLHALPADPGEEHFALGQSPTSRPAMSDRCTCPVADVRGNSSTTTTRRGCLNVATRPSRCRRKSSTDGSRGPFGHDDRSADDLAPLGIGHTYDRHVHNSRIVRQRRFHLDRRYGFAAGANDLALASDNGVATVLVALDEVAGVVPAILNHEPGFVGHVVVPRHQSVRGQQQLSVRPHLRFEPRYRPANRSRLAQEVGIAQAQRPAHLGRPIADGHAH